MQACMYSPSDSGFGVSSGSVGSRTGGRTGGKTGFVMGVDGMGVVIDKGVGQGECPP